MSYGHMVDMVLGTRVGHKIQNLYDNDTEEIKHQANVLLKGTIFLVPTAFGFLVYD